jgi:hypothetical protein
VGGPADLFALPMRINHCSPVNLVNRWKAIFRWVRVHSKALLALMAEADRERYDPVLKEMLVQVQQARQNGGDSPISGGSPTVESHPFRRAGSIIIERQRVSNSPASQVRMTRSGLYRSYDRW